MCTARDNNEVAHCDGSKEEYISLLCCGKLDAFKGKIFDYYGETLNERLSPKMNIMLMNTNINNIAYRIVHEIVCLSFFHNQFIITEDEHESLLKNLEIDYVKNTNYLRIKQINIIRLVFDVCRKASILASKLIHLQIEHTTFLMRDALCVIIILHIIEGQNI